MQRFKRQQRSKEGVLGTPMLCVGVLVALVIGASCIALAHVSLVRTQLQDAADAAALSGAANLWSAPDQVESAALKIARANFVDGQRVHSGSPGTEIRVVSFPGDDAHPGWIKVQASRRVEFMCGGLCGLPKSSVISTSALSGTAGRVTTVNKDQLFPLALSIDAKPMDRTIAERPLSAHCLGDSIALLTNAQQTRNVSFTTFFHPANDAEYLRASLQQALGLKQIGAGFVPKVTVGDTIYLNNSASGTHFLALGDQGGALSRHPVITMPVIKGNPQYEERATVIGFVSARVEGFTLNPAGQELNSLNVRLVKGLVRGSTKPLPGSDDTAVDDALAELSTGIVKLLPDNYLDKRLAHADGPLRRIAIQDSRHRHKHRRDWRHANQVAPARSEHETQQLASLLQTASITATNGTETAMAAPKNDLHSSPVAVHARAQTSWLWLLLLLNGLLLVFIGRRMSTPEGNEQSSLARVRRRVSTLRLGTAKSSKS